MTAHGAVAVNEALNKQEKPHNLKDLRFPQVLFICILLYGY